MRTRTWELQGGDVPVELRGRTITISEPENYREAESLTINGESDVVAKFADGRVIAGQGRIRNKSAKALKDANGDADKALAVLQADFDGFKYTIRAEGTGPTATKPETQAARAEKEVGNKVFIGIRAGAIQLDRMVKLGVTTAEAYQAWLTKQEEIDAKKSAK